MLKLLVNCQWSAWQIGPCSATCGDGTRRNTRLKIVDDKNGGECIGEDVEEQYCKKEYCLGIISLKNDNIILLNIYLTHKNNS